VGEGVKHLCIHTDLKTRKDQDVMTFTKSNQGRSSYNTAVYLQITISQVKQASVVIL